VAPAVGLGAGSGMIDLLTLFIPLTCCISAAIGLSWQRWHSRQNRSSLKGTWPLCLWIPSL